MPPRKRAPTKAAATEEVEAPIKPTTRTPRKRASKAKIKTEEVDFPVVDRIESEPEADSSPVSEPTNVRFDEEVVVPVALALNDNERLAREVVAGEWGNNPHRSRRLRDAGFSPTAVEVEVKRISEGELSSVRLSVGLLAQQVIEGQWGEGLERRRRLIAAGHDADTVFAEVQKREVANSDVVA